MLDHVYNISLKPLGERLGPSLRVQPKIPICFKTICYYFHAKLLDDIQSPCKDLHVDMESFLATLHEEVTLSTEWCEGVIATYVPEEQKKVSLCV